MLGLMIMTIFGYCNVTNLLIVDRIHIFDPLLLNMLFLLHNLSRLLGIVVEEVGFVISVILVINVRIDIVLGQLSCLGFRISLEISDIGATRLRILKQYMAHGIIINTIFVD